MAKPTVYPRWAENSETDSLTGAENKVEPTEEFKLSGLKRGEFLARAFANYQFDLLSRWVEYFDLEHTVFDLSGATDISYLNGGYQTITLTANTTFTESMTSGETVYMLLTNGGFTPTYPASVDWGNAGVPTLATTDLLKFTKIGSTVYATQEWSKT